MTLTDIQKLVAQQARCPECGKLFTRAHGNQRLCSEACREVRRFVRSHAKFSDDQIGVEEVECLIGPTGEDYAR